MTRRPRNLCLQPRHIKNAPARDVVATVSVFLPWPAPARYHLLSCFHLVPADIERKDSVDILIAPKKRCCSACAHLGVKPKPRALRSAPREVEPIVHQMDEILRGSG